jgi:prophage regulatory protein
MALTGISSTSTLYRWISEGRFPKPVKLGLRASGWFLDDIDAWVNSRKAG